MDASIFYLFSGYFFTPDSQKYNVKDYKYVNKNEAYTSTHEDRVCQRGISRFYKDKYCKKLNNYDRKRINIRKFSNKSLNTKLKNAKIMINLMKSVISRQEIPEKEHPQKSFKLKSSRKPLSNNEIWNLIFALVKKLKRKVSDTSLQSSTKQLILNVQRVLKKQQQKKDG